MRGETTVTFDEFNFDYSKSGKVVEGNSIVVREPGLGHFEVYATMSAYVGEAIMKISERRSGQQSAAKVEDPNEETETLDEKSEDEIDSLVYMRMGLGPEKYPNFLRYAKTIITGKTKLAHVGGDEKAPISDEIWDQLDRKGGMEAVLKVVSEFTGFFFAALDSKSPKKSGAAPSTSSVSQPQATSPTSAGASSRLRKS